MSKKVKGMGIEERMLHEIEARELTGYRVAKMAGLNESVVRKWLASGQGLSLASIEKVAKALGLFLR